MSGIDFASHHVDYDQKVAKLSIRVTLRDLLERHVTNVVVGKLSSGVFMTGFNGFLVARFNGFLAGAGFHRYSRSSGHGRLRWVISMRIDQANQGVLRSFLLRSVSKTGSSKTRPKISPPEMRSQSSPPKERPQSSLIKAYPQSSPSNERPKTNPIKVCSQSSLPKERPQSSPIKKCLESSLPKESPQPSLIRECLESSRPRPHLESSPSKEHLNSIHQRNVLNPI